MIYFGVLMVFGIAWLIDIAEQRRDRRVQAKCNATHQEMYDLIDEYFGHSPALAREHKAYTDTFIHGVTADSGYEYHAEIDEVTDEKERKARTKALENGTYELYKANALSRGFLIDAIDTAMAEALVEDEPEVITEGQGIENLTMLLMNAGMSRAEAHNKAQNSYRIMKGMV